MKTFYILRNSDKLLSKFQVIQVFENLKALKNELAILTITYPYLTIYKVEREALSCGQVIEINPTEDQAAILHVFQQGWEIFFQPIDQFPIERRASQVHLPQKPDTSNLDAICKLLKLKPSTTTPAQNTYIETLNTFLRPGIFTKNKQDQWQEIFKLRLNSTFYPLICQYPDLSRDLFQNTARAAGEEAQTELASSTKLAPLFQESASQVPILTVSQAAPPSNNPNPLNFNGFSNDLKK